MEDTTQLETLDYKPECECVACKEEKQPTSAPPATMGFNSVIIKLETRAKKGKVADQHLQESLCRETEPEQPNQNLMLIEEIEGLMSQMNDKLWEIPLETSDKRNLLIRQTLEEIDLFQKTTLFDLRKSFE